MELARRFGWVLGVVVLTGCDMTQPSLRKPTATVGRAGRMVEAKRCALAIVILTRPKDDRLLNEVAWQVADEQSIPPDLRRALATNGLRVGRISGDLPPAVDALLRAESTEQPSVSTVVYPSGQSTLIDATHAAAVAKLDLLLSLPGGSVTGKPYEDVKGFVRVTPVLAATNAVELRVVPEVHHGPIQQSYGMLPEGEVAAPREFKLSRGQAEEAFRELQATIPLEPGQWAVLGTRADSKGTLGDLIFRNVEKAEGRETQTLVLIQARRGDFDSSRSTNDATGFPIALIPDAKPIEKP